jgi:uncharacterized RDD family membrane protein YckC
MTDSKNKDSKRPDWNFDIKIDSQEGSKKTQNPIFAPKQSTPTLGLDFDQRERQKASEMERDYLENEQTKTRTLTKSKNRPVPPDQNKNKTRTITQTPTGLSAGQLRHSTLDVLTDDKLFASAHYMRRVFAVILDGIFLTVLQKIFQSLDMFKVFIPASSINPQTIQPAELLRILPQLVDVFWPYMALSFLLWALYTLFPIYLLGGTAGKRIAGIRIIRTDCEVLGIFRIFFRETLGKGLSIMILGLGFLMPLVTKNNRALHDLLFGTRVVRG